MIPSTFTLTSARIVTYDDGVRGLILDGITHAAGLICSDCKGSGWSAGDLCGGCGAAGFISPPGDEPVSVTVFLGRGDDITENIADITRALTEGDPDRLVDLAIEAGGHCQRTVGYVGPESRALTEGDTHA